MSIKVTQKVSELLTVLVFIFVFCTGVVCYGVATRPESMTEYVYVNMDETLESSRSQIIRLVNRRIGIYSVMANKVVDDLGKVAQSLYALAEDAKEKYEPVLEGPALYDSYIYEITSTIYTDVDPELVRAIVHTESRYDPTRVNSRTGCMGLTGISPKWHTKRALSLGVTDLLDPYGNLLTCCDILHELYQSYSKNYSLDVYAGGYPYANDYKGSLSPHTKLINRTIQGLQDGSIIPGEG